MEYREQACQDANYMRVGRDFTPIDLETDIVQRGPLANRPSDIAKKQTKSIKGNRS